MGSSCRPFATCQYSVDLDFLGLFACSVYRMKYVSLGVGTIGGSIRRKVSRLEELQCSHCVVFGVLSLTHSEVPEPCNSFRVQ